MPSGYQGDSGRGFNALMETIANIRGHGQGALGRRRQDLDERESEIATAFKLLASGDKEGAAKVLAGQGIDVGGQLAPEGRGEAIAQAFLGGESLFVGEPKEGGSRLDRQRALLRSVPVDEPEPPTVTGRRYPTATPEDIDDPEFPRGVTHEIIESGQPSEFSRRRGMPHRKTGQPPPIRLKTPTETAVEEARSKAEIERQTITETDPRAYMTSLLVKKSKGQTLTPEEEEGLRSTSQFLLSISGRDKTAKDAFEEDVFTAMREGRELNPVQQEYLNRAVFKAEPKSEEERILRKIGKTGIESLSPGEKHIFDNFMTPKLENKYLRQLIDMERLELGRRREARQTREGEARTGLAKESQRSTILERVRSAIKDAQFRSDRKRQNIPLGKNRQSALAKIDSEEQQTIQALIERAKKQYPELAEDIDAFMVGEGSKKRPELIEIFKEAFQ